ncbi:MAG TPA: GGDEF domain-containing protein, partial [Arenimonas sp.]|nr:GGDEF domain-containing protein [Arenimonas sp.]
MLDERTLLFMLSVVPALMALVAAGMRHGHAEMATGLGSWALSLACFSFASLVVAIWPVSSVDARIVLSNAGFAPAVTLYGFALLKFFGRPLRAWPWLVGALALYVVSVALSQAPWQSSWRIAIFSVYWLTMVALAGSALLRSGEWRQGVGGAVLLAALLLMAVAISVRLLLALGGSERVLLLAGGMSGFMALFLAATVVGLVLGTLGLVLLASERVRRRLEYLARHDALTGLLTRGGFTALSTQALASARRQGAPVGFLVVDIDHFKAINDGFGHQAGDEVLAAVARCLQATSREADLVSRFGGE